MYQLVLQFAPWGNRPLDDLIALEDQLLGALGAAVDGHDIGAGEANVFIVTSDPEAAFGRALPIVEASGMWELFGAGIRGVNDDAYARWWPRDDPREFNVK